VQWYSIRSLSGKNIIVTAAFVRDTMDDSLWILFGAILLFLLAASARSLCFCGRKWRCS
ncbi:hypothetical protein NDU88_003548, partial [Pleurodeles waltl]